MAAFLLNDVMACFAEKFIQKTAGEKPNRVADNIFIVSAENASEYNGQNNHIKKRLQKTPKNAEPRVSVFQFNILSCKLAKEVFIFFKHLDAVIKFLISVRSAHKNTSIFNIIL